MIKKIRNKLAQITGGSAYNKSYSQCGEDMIVAFALNELHVTKISYLDIGCHHPTYLSNTAYFYENGHHGVCIEPDPFLFKTIEKKRTRDICINAGIGIDQKDKADFYIMSAKALNTFSKQEAERYQSYGKMKIEKIIQMPMITVNEVIKKHFHPYPNLVSLDIEGIELEILKTFDFKKYRPEVFCIETLTYTENKTEEKVTSILDYMKEQGYFIYADTYINTIFVDQKSWNNR